jgi:hypothetical protein
MLVLYTEYMAVSSALDSHTSDWEPTCIYETVNSQFSYSFQYTRGETMCRNKKRP